MKPRNVYCSFCRKTNRDVGPLIEGPRQVYICSECVTLCQSIIEQENRRRLIRSGPAVPELRMVQAALDKLVAGQECAKTALSKAACSRHERKGRILLIGPSQSSAMFLAKALAHALDVPFAGGDASEFSKTGKGNLIFNLLEAADFDVEAAKHGVIFAGGLERLEAQDALS